MPDRDVLRDHAAQRDSQHVRALDQQMVEQPNDVVGHVFEPIRRLLGGGSHRRRQTRVAVVEDDHVQPFANEAIQ